MDDFFLSHLLSSSLLFSIQVVTQIRGHIAGSSPLPTTVHDLHFNREIFIPLLPLTRVELSLPTLDALSCWVFFAFQVNSKSHHGEIRTQGLILVAFEDYYQSTGGTGLHADHTCTCEEPGTCKIMGGGLNRPSVCISHDRMITYKIFQSVSQPRELSVLP